LGLERLPPANVLVLVAPAAQGFGNSTRFRYVDRCAPLAMPSLGARKEEPGHFGLPSVVRSERVTGEVEDRIESSQVVRVARFEAHGKDTAEGGEEACAGSGGRFGHDPDRRRDDCRHAGLPFEETRDR
jgi:hypothetical protein